MKDYLYFMFFLPLLSFAQIKGQIVDQNNNPLEYATAALFKQSNGDLVSGTVTDIGGFFIFETVPEGRYNLEASFMGYQTLSLKNVVLTKNTENNLGLLKLSLGNALDEVVITAEKATVINTIDKQVFDAKKFKTAQGGTALDVLKNMPAVAVDGQGRLSVRGSFGFVVLINDRPTQIDINTILSQLPANAIEKVEFITAPSAKYDPEGKAGIVNIITKKKATNGAFGQITVKGGAPSIEKYDNAEIHQRYGLEATYNIQKDKFNISLGGSLQRNDLGGIREGEVYTILDNIKTVFPSTGERSFDELSYNGRFTLDFMPDSLNNFTIGFYAGKRSKKRLADIVYYDNHALAPADSDNRIYTFQYFNHNLRERKSDFALGSLDYNHRFKNKAKLSASLLFEYTMLGGPTENQNLGFPDNDILYQDEYNTNENPLNGVRFQTDYRFKPLAIGQIEMGYQYRNLNHKGDFIYQRRTDFEAPFELVPEFSSQVDLDRSINAVYGQLTGEKGNWQYAAGARLEAMTRELNLKDRSNTIDTTYTYNFVKIYPSATLGYVIDKKTNIKASYSKRVERTTTFKMNPFPEREHSETLEQGDPLLRPEFIDLLELRFDKKLRGGNSYYATAYFRNTSNLVNRVNTVYNDSILNRIYSNVGKGQSIGLELGGEFKINQKWSNFIGANIYNYEIDGSFDGFALNTKTTVYSMNLNSTYRFWNNAAVQFSFNYLSDRVTAQGEDSRYYAPNLTFNKSFLDNSLTATLQWKNIDMGWLYTNEQRITTFRDQSFYTTTNYIYEVDMITLNLTYTFKDGKNKSKFIDSEFGKREF